MASRALVIGLDGAPPDLLFECWLDELPVLRGLTQRGTYGVLRSCDPEGLYVLAADGVRAGPGPERDLRDIAPTLLALLGEPIPLEMEGSPLL